MGPVNDDRRLMAYISDFNKDLEQLQVMDLQVHVLILIGMDRWLGMSCKSQSKR